MVLYQIWRCKYLAISGAVAPLFPGCQETPLSRNPFNEATSMLINHAMGPRKTRNGRKGTGNGEWGMGMYILRLYFQ